MPLTPANINILSQQLPYLHIGGLNEFQTDEALVLLGIDKTDEISSELAALFEMVNSVSLFGLECIVDACRLGESIVEYCERLDAYKTFQNSIAPPRNPIRHTTNVLTPMCHKISKFSATRNYLYIDIDYTKYDKELLEVTVVDNHIVIVGSHGEKEDAYGTIESSFKRRFALPKSVPPESVQSQMTPNGHLIVMGKAQTRNGILVVDVEKSSARPSSEYTYDDEEILYNESNKEISSFAVGVEYVLINLDISAFEKEKLEISVVDNHIVIVGSHGEKEDAYGTIESSFKRRFPLPEAVPPEMVRCGLHMEHLTIDAKAPEPKQEGARPIQIKVINNSAQHQQKQ